MTFVATWNANGPKTKMDGTKQNPWDCSELND